MSKFTEEEIKFLEQAIELETIDGEMQIRRVLTSVRGSVGGSVCGSVKGSVVARLKEGFNND